MSYILDALRRADAERERGAVPGLHAKPLPLDSPGGDGAARRSAWLPIAAGSGIALLALVALGWWMRPAAVAPASAPTPAPAVIAAAPPPAPSPASPPTPAALPPPGAAAPQPPAAAVTAAPPPAPARPRAEKAEKVDRPQKAERAEKPEKAVRAASPEKAPPKPATPAVAPATPLAQLPPEARAQLPPMTVGGWIYSDSPSSRFVMINGQVVREGEPAATGVVLERIGPKSAVLRWREWRIEIPL